MGNALMVRRGSAKDMNFCVYTGAEEPEKLQENTIWINTDISVPEWSIARKNPYVAYKDKDLMSGKTTQEGYFSSSGSVSNPDATKKEVYTMEYIPVQFGITYRYEYGASAAYSQWLEICEYTSDQTFITRLIPVNGTTGVFTEGTYSPSRSTAAYVRMSWRTYGDAMTAVSLIEPNAEYTPDDVKYGTVWIQEAPGGAVKINALRRNGLIVNLADVKSLIGLDPFDAERRTWMDIPGYMYQDGEWKEIRMLTAALYDMGDICYAITGGWTKGSGTLTMNTDHMFLAGSPALVHTVKMIDLTDYTKIRFSVLASSTSAITIVGADTGTSAGSFAASVTLPFNTKEYTDFDVDISGLKGEYYVKIQTHASSVGCSVRSVTLL